MVPITGWGIDPSSMLVSGLGWCVLTGVTKLVAFKTKGFSTRALCHKSSGVVPRIEGRVEVSRS